MKANFNVGVTGDIVEGVTEAFLDTANVSALLRRVAYGVARSLDNGPSHDDAVILKRAGAALLELSKDMRVLEERPHCTDHQSCRICTP